MSLQALLELLGHKVIAAENGVTALARLAEADWRPDLIVCDFNLPGGMNGLEVVKKARKQLHASTPAVLLTGDVSLAPDRVRQVLLNLIGNAVKFTDHGEVSVTAAYVGGRLRLAVRDTGAGVPADRLEALFKRFSQVDVSSTRRHGGTGLGLAICKGLVEAMGGTIGVESIVGQGSCFWFEIPAPIARPATAAVPAPEPAGRAEGCRVLVADDNPANRDLVAAVLQTLSAELVEADDGAAAIALAEIRAFDLILMDLRMPVMDGEAAARRIRTGQGPNRSTPIIAFSADASTRVDETLFSGLLAKPLDPRALLSGVASAMIDGRVATAA